jgi:putative protein kinase ArgK-like GTPase of G3E family
MRVPRHLLDSAQHTAADYAGALPFLRQKHLGSAWRPQVMLTSARSGLRVDEVVRRVLSCHATLQREGRLQVREREEEGLSV